MELRQLEYFVRIADTGSINEAARKLNMSQPPLSYSLRQLEGELGAELFTRSAKGVELTAAGRLLYERAENLLEFAHSTKKEVSEAGKRRVLRIGITSSTVPTVLPFIAEFALLNPDVSFEVHDGSSYTLLQLLLDGIIDISVARTPLRLDSVDSLPLSHEPMLAVSPTSAPPECEYTDHCRLADLIGRKLIIYRRYEELIMSTFASQGLTPEVFCICDDARDAMLWVGAGLATAIFPASMRSMCRELDIKTLSEPTLETETLLITKRGAVIAPLARELLAVCSELLGGR